MPFELQLDCMPALCEERLENAKDLGVLVAKLFLGTLEFVETGAGGRPCGEGDDRSRIVMDVVGDSSVCKVTRSVKLNSRAVNRHSGDGTRLGIPGSVTTTAFPPRSLQRRADVPGPL